MTLAYLSTTANRKIHFEFASPNLALLPSCGSGGPITERLTELDDDGNIDQLIAALSRAKIPPSRVCRRCFAVKTVAEYTASRDATS